MITRGEAAKAIAKAIEGIESKTEDYHCSVWQKDGKCRIYVKDMSYSTSTAQDRGFVHVNTDGSVGYENLKSSRGVKKAIDSLDLSIADDPEGRIALNLPDIQTPEERAIRNLNRRFGSSGWDRFDLDDELEREEYS